MGKAIVTTTSAAFDALTAGQRRHVASAYSALAALEPSPTRIRKAAATVGTLRTDGLSIRGIVAVLSVQGQGTLPTGKGTIERLGYVADAIGGEWPDTGDSADAILMALYRIAQTGKASDVARAAELGRKAVDGDTAFTAVDAVRRELNAAEHKALTSKPAREVGGEAADGGKRSTGEDTDADVTPVKASRTDADVSRELGAYTLTSLLTEAVKRTAVKGFYADADIAALIATLAERAEQSADAHAAEGDDEVAPEAVSRPARKRSTVKAGK